MAKNLPKENIRYIEGTIRSLKEKFSGLKYDNVDEVKGVYEAILKEHEELTQYIDNLLPHFGEVHKYESDLLAISVNLENVGKYLVERGGLPNKGSSLEVKVDQEGTSFGGGPELAAPVENKAYQPEEPSSTDLGSGTNIGLNSVPSLPVEPIEDPPLSADSSDSSIDYKNTSGLGRIRRIPKSIKTLIKAAVIAGLLYSGYYGLKSCNGSLINKKEVVEGNEPNPETTTGSVTPTMEGQDVPYCRYDGQFAFDSTKIIKGKKGLEKVIQNWPKNAPIYIAASSSVDGGDDYNMILSENRADAIKNNVEFINKNNAKEVIGIGETSQFSKEYGPNRRFVVSTKYLDKDNLHENAPAIGQATDGCGVIIEPEHYKVAKNGKYKKEGDIADKNPVPDLIPLPDKDDVVEPGVPIDYPNEPPVEKDTFNYPKYEDLEKQLPKYDESGKGKNFTGDDKNDEPPVIINGEVENGSEKINYTAIEGEVPTVDYTHEKKSVADDDGDFLVLEGKKELQNINLKKKSTDHVGDDVIDNYIGEKPIKKLKDKDEKGNDIDYKGKIKINVEPQSLNLEKNTTLLGALLDYIVPSADAAMINEKPYAEVKEWDVDIEEKKDKNKEDNDLEKMIKQNLVADVSYLTGSFNRKTLINEGSETVEYDGRTDGIGAVLGYKTDKFNVHALMQSTKTKAKVKTEAFDGDYEEEAVGIGGGLEFNLGHKRKTNVKLDAIFENRKAKQIYELVDVSTEVKTDNTIIDIEIENKNLFIDGKNYDLGLRLRGLQQSSSIKQDVTAAIPPQEELSKDVQYSDYQGGLVFDISKGKLNMKTTVDYVLMQRPDLSSDSVLNGQSLLSRIEIGKNAKLIAFAEVPLGGDILRNDYGIMIGQERFRIGDMDIKLPGWAIHFLSSNEELLTEIKTTKKKSNSVMFELKWNFDDDLFNFWNRTLQFN